jgi:hypothetical protein
MFLRVFRSGASVVLVLVVACLVLPFSVSAEDEATSAAGLVIDTGEGEPIYVVVTFTGEEMRALDLLRQTDLDAVTVEFGGLGSAVCSIATVGCDVSTCRKRLCQTGDPESPFWQYLEEAKPGEWTLSPLGASQAALADGEIAAWAWTGVPPDLPPLSWKDLASRAGAPDEVAAGEIAGEPVVYISGLEEPQTDNSATGTMAGAGIVVLIAMIGGWLVVRQRAGRAS